MTDGQPADNIQQTLGLGRGGNSRWRWRLALAFSLVLVVLLWLWLGDATDTTFSYRTAPVERGDLTLMVTATGNLQPLNQVEVGSEVSGTIARVLVDFNDSITLDQVLAQLDTSTLINRVAEAKAALLAAEAGVKEAQATELEKRLALSRCRELAKQQMCSANDIDVAAAAHARAQAGVASAKAQVAMAQAVLSGHQTSLEKTTIRSPINGIVLDRKVEPGQTVAASFQTPVLFTLAEDLSRMELIVAVDEADIGRIRHGQQAIFNVDAFANRSFNARITQVRHAPQTIEGVVSYETVLSVNNEELQLLPGMTATAEIITREIDNALLIPNAALRYSPPLAPVKSQTGGSVINQLFSRSRSPRQTPLPAEAGMMRQIWLLKDGEPQALMIKLGESDGRYTEVLDGELEPGMALITESIQANP